MQRNYCQRKAHQKMYHEKGLQEDHLNLVVALMKKNFEGGHSNHPTYGALGQICWASLHLKPQMKEQQDFISFTVLNKFLCQEFTSIWSIIDDTAAKPFVTEED